MARATGHNSSTSFSGSPSAASASGEGASRPSLSSSGSSFLRHFRPRTSDGRRNAAGFAGFGPFGNHSSAAVTSTQPASPGAETEEMADLTRISSTGLRANMPFFPRSSSSASTNNNNNGTNFNFPSSGDGLGRATPDATPSRRPALGQRAPSRGSAAGEEARLREGSPSMIRSGSSGGGPFGRMVRRLSLGTGRSEAADLAAARAPPGRANQDLANGSRNVTPLPGAIPASQSAVNSTTRASEERAGPAASSSASSAPNGAVSGSVAAATTDGEARQTHRIRLVPHLEATRSLHFEPIERDLVEGNNTVKIGRFTDRNAGQSLAGAANASNQASPSPASASVGGNIVQSQAMSASANTPLVASAGSAPQGAPGARGGAIPSSAGGGGRVDSARIAFKSKVVSRGHAEVWCEAGGNFFIRDTKSSSGTFLNHIRLSAPNAESRPFPIKDGDVVQLGVDYQGGTEEIYRCVKMRVELNRGWQRAANEFNMSALRQLRALQGTPVEAPKAKTPVAAAAGSQPPTNRQSMSVTDCCICLFSVTVCQSLFIAPCSHVFHYKCIRPLLLQHHPGFSCPLCRTFADLEADVEQDDAWQEALIKEAAKSASTNDPEVTASTPMAEIEPSPLAIAELAGSPPAHHSHQPSESLTVAGSHLRRPVPSEAARTNGWAVPDTGALTAAASPSPDTTVDPGAATSGYNPSRVAVTPPLESPGIPETEDEQEELLDEGGDYASMIDEADLAGLTTVSPVSDSRRGSNPIDVPSGQQRHSNAPPVPSPINDLENARTPQNNTFLSTLAEAPPPARSAIRAGAGTADRSSQNMPSLSAALSENAARLGTLEAANFSQTSEDVRRPSTTSVHSEVEVFATPQDGNSPGTANSNARTIPSGQGGGELLGASTPFAYASELDDGILTGPSSFDGPFSQIHGQPSSTRGKRPLNLSVAEEEDEVMGLEADVRMPLGRKSPYRIVDMETDLSRASLSTSRSGHRYPAHQRNSLGGSAGGSSVATGHSAVDQGASSGHESPVSTSSQGKFSRLLKKAQNTIHH